MSASSNRIRDYYELTKPKVVALIVFTAVVGMFLATPGMVPLDILILGTLGIGLAAASAAAINQLLEYHLDARMGRTKRRPLPTGKVSVREAIALAFVLGLASVLLLWLAINPLTAVLTFASLIGYAFIYTLWLKHASPQNIVIGGVSGAAPPLLGWTAVTGSVDPHALLLVLIIFIWTPPHFWALAIKHREDYTAAGVPMLPVVESHEKVIRSMILYTIALTISSLVIIPVGDMGWVYGISAAVLGLGFLWGTIALGRSDSPAASMKLFSFSISYITVLFVALTVDVFVR